MWCGFSGGERKLGMLSQDSALRGMCSKVLEGGGPASLLEWTKSLKVVVLVLSQLMSDVSQPRLWSHCPLEGTSSTVVVLVT
jgi:hypothetical protein